MIPRVFVGSDNINNNIALIDGSDVNYLKNVLRLKPGDELSVIDSKSVEYSARVDSFGKGLIRVKLAAEKHVKNDPKVKISIAQGLPKNPKMDLIVQKSTELGAAELIPMICERSIIKLDEIKANDKVKRWQKIAKEAAEQSGRSSIPSIQPVTKFRDTLKFSERYDKCVMLWEMEKERTIKDILRKGRKIKSFLVLIGPEGGFSREEAEAARSVGFLTASLGNRIVRAETAPLVVLSMINYEFEL